MKVGIPREVKNHEYRVAITPAGVHELSRNGHEVFVETDAGVGSSISNDEFIAAGASILPTADDVWQTGELILKVKEPIAEEYHRMRKEQVLFTYLHLAAAASAPMPCSRPGRQRLRTRLSSFPIAHFRCWLRCPRWPVAWGLRWALQHCSEPMADAARCSAVCPA